MSSVLSIVVAQITFASKPDLQITMYDLTKEGFRLRRLEPASTQKFTNFQVITIPHFMIPVELTVSIDRTSLLAKKFEAQYRTSVILGDAIVRDMSVVIPEFQIAGCAILQTGEFDNGSDPNVAYEITVGGGMLVNTALLIGLG